MNSGEWVVAMVLVCKIMLYLGGIFGACFVIALATGLVKL